MRRIPIWLFYTGLSACLLLTQYAEASGPAYVSGSSYFDPSVKGSPLVWPNNTITCYTDQGELSPALPGPSADALVAEAFVKWTNIPTVVRLHKLSGALGDR